MYILKLSIFTIFFIFYNFAYAGKSCEVQPQNNQTVDIAIKQAVYVHEQLDKTNAKVVLIARVGQDLSKYKLKYSHVAFAYKKNDTWEVFHELNQCGSDSSSLYIEGLANFFLDGMFSYDAKIFIPSEDLQNKLYSSLVNNSSYAKNLHGDKYNMLAWPFSTKYQNSNQWILEVLAQSLSQEVVISNRDLAQKWLSLNGYTPSTLEIGAMTRLGARMFKANIAFDDQPFDRRMAGHIDTITVESIFNFITKKDTGNFIELNTLVDK